MHDDPKDQDAEPNDAWADAVLDQDALAREFLTETEYRQCVVRENLANYLAVTSDEAFLRKEGLDDVTIAAILFAQSTCGETSERLPDGTLLEHLLASETTHAAAVDAWIRENVS